MDIYELFEAQRQLANQYIDGMEEVLPQDLGLDRRCGYRLYINKEAIAVPAPQDGSLQYYGGFQYIDKAYRTELGDWVIYTIDDQTHYGFDEDNDCRVAECIKHYYEPEQLCPVED
jgi:hypothetical protein